MLNEARALDVAIVTDARLVIANRVIKRMTICKELEFVTRTVNETKAMSQREMVLRQMKSFTGKLPQNRANEIMTYFIRTVNATKNTGPDNSFMHMTGSGPGTTNSLKPAHSEVGTRAQKNSSKFFKPVKLRNI